jgi:hypothetical protein
VLADTEGAPRAEEGRDAIFRMKAGIRPGFAPALLPRRMGGSSWTVSKALVRDVSSCTRFVTRALRILRPWYEVQAQLL